MGRIPLARWPKTFGQTHAACGAWPAATSRSRPASMARCCAYAGSGQKSLKRWCGTSFTTDEKVREQVSKGRLKIRIRERIQSSPPPGQRQWWIEYQVLDGRKIIARCDTEAEAERFIA